MPHHRRLADRGNHRVQVLRYSDRSHVRTIGSTCSGNGQFDVPSGVLIDSCITVSEYDNPRIQVYSAIRHSSASLGLNRLDGGERAAHIAPRC
jgi:hypothetical protein